MKISTFEILAKVINQKLLHPQNSLLWRGGKIENFDGVVQQRDKKHKRGL